MADGRSHMNFPFADLAGWTDHDHEAAFAAFRASARTMLNRPPTSRDGSARAEDLAGQSANWP